MERCILLTVISVARQIPWLIEQLKDQKDVLEFVNRIFSEVGLGISNMGIMASQFDEWVTKTNDSERNIINSLLNNTGAEPNRTVSKMGSEVPMYSISTENGGQGGQVSVSRRREGTSRTA